MRSRVLCMLTLSVLWLVGGRGVAVAEVRRGAEGGWTKNDPGVLPDGHWHVDYTNLGPIVPSDLLTIAPTLMPSVRPTQSLAPDPTPRVQVITPTATRQPRYWLGGNGTCSAPSDPVSVTGGQLIIPIREVDIPSRGRESGLFLRFERTYSSRSTYEGPLGFGWQVEHNVALTDLGDTVQIKGPDGTPFIYTRTESGYTSAPADGSTLAKLADGTFRWTRWTPLYGIEYFQFNTANQLAYIEDPHGNRLTYAYSGALVTQITDVAGRALQFTYDDHNRITQVAFPAGGAPGSQPTTTIIVSGTVSDPTATVTVNGIPAALNGATWSMQLALALGPNTITARAEDLVGHVTTHRIVVYYDPTAPDHAHETPLRITVAGTVDEYDTTVMVNLLHHQTTSATQEAIVSGTTWSTNNFPLYTGVNTITATVTDPTGHANSHTINVYVEPPENVPTTRTFQFAYDAAGNLIRVVDPLGQTTTYEYADPADIHNMTTMREPLGNVTRFVYDPQYDSVLTVIDPLGQETRYTYDFTLGITTVTDPKGQTTVFEFAELATFDTGITRVTDPLGGQTVYTYDDRGLRNSVRDVNGNTTSWVNDRYTNALEIHGALGDVTLAMDPTFHAVTQLTDSLGRIFRYTYDEQGNLISETDPLGNVIRHIYDTHGQRLSTTDPLGQTVTYTYDDAGNLTSVTDAEGFTTTYTYDTVGNVLTRTDALNRVTRYSYDALNRVTRITFPDGGIARYRYDAAGNVVEAINTLGNATAYAYDARYRLIRVTDALGQTTTLARDAVGHLTQVTDANGHATAYEYDAFGRVTAIVDAAGGRTAYSFAGGPPPTLMDQPTSLTDANGHMTRFTYDAAYRRIAVTDPLGQTTQLAHDAIGNMVAVTDANGNATSMAYDANNRLIRTTNALDRGATRTYDANGNLSTKTDFNGQMTSYAYNARNLLTRVTYPGGASVNDTYDGLGNRVSMTDATGTTTYAYDARNRLTRQTSSGVNATIAYTYDTEGNRRAMTDQDGKVTTYAYDSLNRVASLTNPLNQATQFIYDAVGNLLTVNYANGTTIQLAYNQRNQRVSAETRNAAQQLLASAAYTFDAAWLLTRLTDEAGASVDYAYDVTNQLVREAKTDAAGAPLYTHDYTYDPAKNRLTMVRDGVTTTYTYDALNQLTQWTDPASTTTYTYDANGNRTQQADAAGTSSYAYDAENRLTQITHPNATTSAFTYDGDGKRVTAAEGIATMRYLYDGRLPVIERDGANSTQVVYTRLLGVPGGIGGLISQTRFSSPATTTWYHEHGAPGNVTHLTDASGVVVRTYAFDAFGQRLAQTGATANAYQFQTKELHANSGLVYFGARWYDPGIGRWLTADPAGFVDGPNLYVYLQNSPLNDVDPWGLCGGGGSYWAQGLGRTFAGIAAAEAFHVGEFMLAGAVASFSAGPVGIPSGIALTAGGAISIGAGAYLAGYALTGHF